MAYKTFSFEEAKNSFKSTLNYEERALKMATELRRYCRNSDQKTSLKGADSRREENFTYYQFNLALLLSKASHACKVVPYFQPEELGFSCRNDAAAAGRLNYPDAKN